MVTRLVKHCPIGDSLRRVTNRSQQLLAALHRTPEGLVTKRTATISRIHGILLEFGVVVPMSKAALRRLPNVIAIHDLPLRLLQIIHDCTNTIILDARVLETEKELVAQLHQDASAARLLSIPGIGTTTASLLASEIGSIAQYAGGRNFAASIGLVPRQQSTGGRTTL